MKVIVNESKEPKEKEQVYPFIGMHRNNIIVLFSSMYTGIVLKPNRESVKLGTFSNNWDMADFIPYKGKVILSND